MAASRIKRRPLDGTNQHLSDAPMAPVTYTHSDGRSGWMISFPDAPEPEEILITHLRGDRFRLDTTPAFSEFASFGDIVELTIVGDRHLICHRVVQKSGLRTIRVLESKGFVSSAAWVRLCERIAELGGHWEQVFGGYLMLHVPVDSIVTVDEALASARAEHARSRKPREAE